MDELINRKLLKKAICKYVKTYPQYTKDGKIFYIISYDCQKMLADIVKIINNMPTEESKIIHCRDCKHYYYADNRIPQEQRYTCDLDGYRWEPDSYYSFGERR